MVEHSKDAKFIKINRVIGKHLMQNKTEKSCQVLPLVLNHTSSPDMPLSDKHSSMVDGFCHSRLEYECLQAALKEVLHS